MATSDPGAGHTDPDVPAEPSWAGLHDLPGSGFGYGARSPQDDTGAGWQPTFPMAGEPRDVRPRWWALALAGAAAALTTVAVLSLFGFLDRTGDSAATAPPSDVIEVREVVIASDGATSAAAVGRKVTPSVVTVAVGDEATDGGFSQFGLGSGVVLDSDGLIVTNAHVVEGATSTQIVLQDGTTFDAEVVAADERTDLAVLRVEGRVLPSIEFGTTDNLEIGDVAIAVGNPLGLAGGASLTVGVISAFEREVDTADSPTLFGMLQTDAPITRGSSGGALVDAAGRLIGITTAIGVSSAGAEGIGFAIPVELVRRITDEMIATGGVRHAFIGVRLDTYLADRDGGGTTPAGAIVTSFPDDVESAAALAGIRQGDVIVGFEGAAVSRPEDVISGVRLYRVGDTVSVDVVRNGETMSLDIVLGERPDDL